MGLGFSTSFIICLGLAVALSFYTHNYWNGIVLVILYAIVKMIWNILR